jgi:hypothetical protein
MARWLDLVRVQQEDHDEAEALSLPPAQRHMLTIVPCESTPDVGDITADLDRDEIAWRVEVVRQQVPQQGPIGFLHARAIGLKIRQSGHCGSCGDMLTSGQCCVCLSCQHAKWLVLQSLGDQRAE